MPITYSALGITAADLLLLIETELSDSNLNLSNLTRLYQAVSLSKKLRLSIPAYLSIRRLSGIDLFGAGAIERTKQFVELVGRVQSNDIEYCTTRLFVTSPRNGRSAGWSV